MYWGMEKRQKKREGAYCYSEYDTIQSDIKQIHMTVRDQFRIML